MTTSEAETFCKLKQYPFAEVYAAILPAPVADAEVILAKYNWTLNEFKSAVTNWNSFYANRR